MSTTSNAPDGAANDPSMADILASIRRILTEDDQPQAAAGPTAPGAARNGAAPNGAGQVRQASPAADEDVLILDRSMMIEAPTIETPPVPALAPKAAPNSAPKTTDEDRTVHLDPAEVAAHQAASEAHGSQTGVAAVRIAVPSGDLSPPPAGSEHVSSNIIATPQVDAAPEPQMPADVFRGRRPPAPALAEPGTVSAVASSLSNLARSVAAERTAAIQRNGLSIEDVVREEVRPLLKAWLDMHLPGLVERLVQAEIERVVNRATF